MGNQPQPNYVQNMDIDPRWLQHHHGDRFGLALASPYPDRAMPSSSSPGPAEFSNDDDDTTNSFPLPDLEFIASPGHIICGVDPNPMVPIM